MQKIMSSSMMVMRNGSEEEVYIDGYVIYDVDNNYGADADGNRGTSKITVQDIQQIGANTINNDEVSLTPGEVNEAKGILTNKFLEGGA